MSAEVSPTTSLASSPGTPDSELQRFVREFARSKVALGAFLLLGVIVFSAMFAPLISPQDPYDLAQLSILEGRLPPGTASYEGFTYWLGTDDQGRDLFSAILYGLRTSLLVGISSGLIAAALGMCIGLVVGYLGGPLDAFVMRVVDFQLGFPSILVALILLAVLGQGVDKIIAALVIVQWAYYTRTVRASAQVEREKEYVEAAHCLAISRLRVVFGHILPNCMPPLIVIGTIQVAHSIGLEATLSFLGLGLPVTEPSLGLLIANGFDYVLSGRYWISFFPGIALLVTIMSINLVGDQLRDVLNPRLDR